MLHYHIFDQLQPNEPVEEVLICEVPDDQDDILLDGNEVADEIDDEQDDY